MGNWAHIAVILSGEWTERWKTSVYNVLLALDGRYLSPTDCFGSLLSETFGNRVDKLESIDGRFAGFGIFIVFGDNSWNTEQLQP